MSDITNGNESAFSMSETEFSEVEFGLSKREYFAAAALQGLLSKLDYDLHDAASDAVSAADYLIQELNK